VYLKGTGSSGLAMSCPDTDCAAAGTYQYGGGEVKGALAEGFLILDPFKDPEGFRLPLMIGAGFFHLEDSAAISSASGQLTASRTFNGIKPVLGISPQFNLTRWFRLAPFLFYLPATKPTDKCTATGSNASCTASITPESQHLFSFGVQATFKPLNLGFLYVIPEPCGGNSCAKNSVYALRWQRSFGGD
jgi:hypothetical protein